MPSSEREDLQELLSIPGFKRLAQHAVQEHVGQGYRYKVRQALQKNDLVEVRVVEAVSEAIERLFVWPEERLQELKTYPEEGDD